ncbi:hypothetical protein Ciccas_008681 [Cichlidogyrus casuarinus]|uniref:Uncharacterized protein n=1 Tax=Cichlidogyrus casuarinus TaxID=1844966 RepID=A0ABD2Q3J2_9PLAT
MVEREQATLSANGLTRLLVNEERGGDYVNHSMFVNWHISEERIERILKLKSFQDEWCQATIQLRENSSLVLSWTGKAGSSCQMFL